MKTKPICCILICLASFSSVLAQELVLSSNTFGVPGEREPTAYINYQQPGATSVIVAGSWQMWTNRDALSPRGALWSLDVRPLGIPFGRHEYKFIVDGEWETGDNRFLYADTSSMLAVPPDVIRQALIQSNNLIEVFFAKPINPKAKIAATLEPPVEIEELRLRSPEDTGYLQGYTAHGGTLTFCFDETTYGVRLDARDVVSVAGNFNGWNPKEKRWYLYDKDDDGIWKLTIPMQAIRRPPGAHDLIFKFVVNHTDWLSPPQHALNATPDGEGNTNLRIDPRLSGSSVLEIQTKEPLDLSVSYLLGIQGLLDQALYCRPDPGKALDSIYSEKELGAILDKERQVTTYRLFAPRATSVHLCIFDGPYYEKHKPEYVRIKPVERYLMWKDPADSVWEITLRGLDTGAYYAFNVDGPSGNGEGFNPLARIGDPYARAAAHAENNSIVIDPDETNRWFGGWTDQAFSTSPSEDVVIYECHLRDMTIHPSSGVPEALRGTYEGLLASDGTGTGLDHLRAMGFNTIEFLPLSEFNNGPEGHNWGYTTVYYFAPEASYGRAPLQGKQYFEFKHMVNELHNKGFNVVMDVVYNHVGSPNLFHMIDRKYYFRLNPDYSYIEFSGCGNDVRTEAPMMRRLIVDNIVYWMTEHHVDGFRLDLAELIDMDTMLAIRDAARAINPDVLLISEPWSFRGENKHELTGTGWSAWNNDFRYAAKDFIMGGRNRGWLMKNIFGSLTTWAATPLQPVNYLESHDDMALADELCTRPDRDGRNLEETSVKVNRLGATILFTSLGIPMIAEGQEYVRSKRGIHNTYDQGDTVNAMFWYERDRPMAKETMDYYRDLIHMRQSEQGRAFRLRDRPENNYYRWLKPKNELALAYIINMNHEHPGASFIVLLNADSRDATFTFTFPKNTTWRQISDGEQVMMSGIPDTPVIRGGTEKTVRVPPIHSAIFMDGF
ncbi:MAG: hypothetical protein EOM20_02150 [Spartobacteria bacterium]|nr:hypothetical protein [Spartobacteria bacterium]